MTTDECFLCGEVAEEDRPLKSVDVDGNTQLAHEDCLDDADLPDPEPAEPGRED